MLGFREETGHQGVEGSEEAHPRRWGLNILGTIIEHRWATGGVGQAHALPQASQKERGGWSG